MTNNIIKIKFVLALLLCLTGLAANAQTPEWVTVHPVSEKEYVGIGSAPLSDTDHVRAATQNALGDIASQIAVRVEDDSFLHIVDIDGHSREMLEDKIRTNATEWIEGHKLVATWTSSDTYYVYYTLDKGLYSRKYEEKQTKTVNTALQYLENGKHAEQSQSLAEAALLYAKGLETVEPWLFMDLSYYTAGGARKNIAAELYDAYINVFSGMVITTSVYQTEGEPFKPVPEPVAACLSKDGEVIPNIRLKAEFTRGAGETTPPSATDFTGTAEFYITNITSKEQVQEVTISIDDSFIDALPSGSRALVKSVSLPSAKISIIVSAPPATLYLHIGDNDLEGCENHIRNLLGNNSFSLTDDPDSAQCFAELNSLIELGNPVSGGNYDLNVCYCTLILKIYDNNSGETLLDYSVNRLKVLSPVHKSAEGTLAAAVREVMKRVNRELPEMLKKVKL